MRAALVVEQSTLVRQGLADAGGGVWGVGIGVQGWRSGLSIYDLGFLVLSVWSGLDLTVYGLRFRLWSLGLWAVWARLWKVLLKQMR